MHSHHRAAVERVTERLRADPELLALLLAGSLAHGFARAGSDVDLLLVVPDEVHEARRLAGDLQFSTAEGCDWPGGYVEGKYVSPGFLAKVAASGSEPARFAFQDARLLFARIEGLPATLAEITRYPVVDKAQRIARFHAQFEAWHWYAHEARKLGDRYLLGLAVSRTVLFGGRMILAHNEQLFPYHKWFLKVLEGVPERPAELMDRIAAVYDDPSENALLSLWGTIRNFRPWEGSDRPWSVQFMIDSELGWLEGRTPVDDL